MGAWKDFGVARLCLGVFWDFGGYLGCFGLFLEAQIPPGNPMARQDFSMDFSMDFSTDFSMDFSTSSAPSGLTRKIF